MLQGFRWYLLAAGPDVPQASSCAPNRWYLSNHSVTFLLFSCFEFEVVGTHWFDISDP